MTKEEKQAIAEDVYCQIRRVKLNVDQIVSSVTGEESKTSVRFWKQFGNIQADFEKFIDKLNKATE